MSFEDLRHSWRSRQIDRYHDDAADKYKVTTFEVGTYIVFYGSDMSYNDLEEASKPVCPATVRAWCAHNGIPIVEHPYREDAEDFYIDPADDDQAFHVKMRWG